MALVSALAPIAQSLLSGLLGQLFKPNDYADVQITDRATGISAIGNGSSVQVSGLQHNWNIRIWADSQLITGSPWRRLEKDLWWVVGQKPLDRSRLVPLAHHVPSSRSIDLPRCPNQPVRSCWGHGYYPEAMHWRFRRFLLRLLCRQMPTLSIVRLLDDPLLQDLHVSYSLSLTQYSRHH